MGFCAGRITEGRDNVSESEETTVDGYAFFYTLSGSGGSF